MQKLEYVSKAKYLGVYIVYWLNKLRCVIISIVHVFIRHLMVYIQKVTEILQLINAYCKPLLTYACECVRFNRSDLSQLDRTWNSVFWKLFKTYDKDCIADIHISISQLPISMDIDTR